MPAAVVKSQEALQELATQCVRLAVIDEVAATSGERPLKQIADCSGYGWGGTVYQLSPDHLSLNVLGQYAGLPPQAQCHWHPRRGELYAQRQVSRARRKHLGRLPATCSTDHVHLVTDTLSPEVDSMTILWMADSESDGSRRKHLGGRSAVLADGL